MKRLTICCLIYAKRKKLFLQKNPQMSPHSYFKQKETLFYSTKVVILYIIYYVIAHQ